MNYDRAKVPRVPCEAIVTAAVALVRHEIVVISPTSPGEFHGHPRDESRAGNGRCDAPTAIFRERRFLPSTTLNGIGKTHSAELKVRAISTRIIRDDEQFSEALDLTALLSVTL